MSLLYATRLCCTACLIAILSGCETTAGGYTRRGIPPPPATPIRDRLIVPAHRIGPVALGMTLSDLVREMGDPDREVRNPKIHITSYIWEGLNVGVSDHMQRVVVIDTFAPGQYVLGSGIGIGSSGLKVRAALGPPSHERVFESGGVNFERDCYSGLLLELHDGVLGSMTVIEPGCP
jgi:hypothetical protein